MEEIKHSPYARGTRCRIIDNRYPPCQKRQCTGSIVFVARQDTCRDPAEPEYVIELDECKLRFPVKHNMLELMSPAE